MQYINAFGYKQADIGIDDERLVYCHPKDINRILLERTSPVILIAEGGDSGVQSLDGVDQLYFSGEKLVENDNLVALYSTNNRLKTNSRFRCVSLPFGVDALQQQYLCRYREIEFDRDIYCYANFSNRTHSSRMAVWQKMKGKSFVTFEERVEGLPRNKLGVAQDIFARNLKRSRFVVCPPGNAFDTYRAWETIYSGAYPVVQRCPMTERFAQNLPFVLIDQLTELTEEHLLQAEKEFRGKQFNYEAATLAYYKKMIVRDLKAI